MSMKVKDKDKDKNENEPSKTAPSVPLLPGQKKKQEKIMQTQHNDKNITKKIEKGSPKKAGKNSQPINTDLSIPPKGSKKVSRQNSVMESKKPLPEEERSLRFWGESNSPE